MFRAKGEVEATETDLCDQEGRGGRDGDVVSPPTGRELFPVSEEGFSPDSGIAIIPIDPVRHPDHRSLQCSQVIRVSPG